jgi:hypothetical protein
MSLTNTDIVLIAILPNPKDLDYARLLGWYRIPLKSAPKVIAVDYLAFYQTAAFDENNRWQIKHIAPVRGHELTTRELLFKEEADHPRAKEEYFKIQIGDLEILNQPIYADHWRRITFFYTTGYLLKNATSIRDLVVEGEDRNILWKTLKERAKMDYGKFNSDSNYHTLEKGFLEILLEWDKIKENKES